MCRGMQFGQIVTVFFQIVKGVNGPSGSPRCMY